MTAALTSLRNSFVRHVVLVALLLGSVFCGSTASAFSLNDDGSAAPTGYDSALGLQSDPLRVWTDELLRTWVYRNQPNIEVPSNFIPQYTDYYRTTLRATNGASTEVYGAHRAPGQFSFTSVAGSHDYLPGDPVVAITATVRTDYVDGDDTSYLEIAHTITMESGASVIRHEWTVNNVGIESYTGVALRYGGNTLHGGYDTARGSYPATSTARSSKLLYCNNHYPSETGLMGMEGATGSGFTGVIGYIEGLYSTVEAALNSASAFPDAVNVDKAPDFPDLYADNGMAMEWRYSGTLAPGGSFTVVLYERWTAPGNLQVIAPADFTAEAGTQETVDFLVINLGPSVEINQIVNAPEGWLTAMTLASNPMAADSVSVATYEIAIPPNTLSGGTLELQVNETLDIDPYQSDATQVTVVPMVITLPTGADLPLSTGSQVVYSAISPATYAGVSSLMSAIDGRSTSVTRAFAWDTNGAYVELPLPVIENPGLRGYLASVNPDTGIFIATRVALDFDPGLEPYVDLTYSSYWLTVLHGSGVAGAPTGWTFAGIPLLRLSDGTLENQFSWYGAPQAGATPLEVLIDGVPADDTTIAQVLGDGSTVDSSRPWSWNSATGKYEQASVLEAGKGYWFKNNTDNMVVTIGISAQGYGYGYLAGGQAKKNSKSASSVTAQSITWHDRGTPPALPGGSGGGSGGGGGAASASGGGGCGSGSGLGLFSMLMFLFGLRFLVARR